MKNPAMSLWLSWANRATSMWTSAAMSAAKRNQATMLKAAMTPPKSRPRSPSKAPKR